MQLAFDITHKRLFFLFKLPLLLVPVIKIATHKCILINILIINMIIAIFNGLYVCITNNTTLALVLFLKGFYLHIISPAHNILKYFIHF